MHAYKTPPRNSLRLKLSTNQPNPGVQGRGLRPLSSQLRGAALSMGRPRDARRGPEAPLYRHHRHHNVCNQRRRACHDGSGPKSGAGDCRPLPHVPGGGRAGRPGSGRVHRLQGRGLPLRGVRAGGAGPEHVLPPLRSRGPHPAPRRVVSGPRRLPVGLWLPLRLRPERGARAVGGAGGGRGGRSGGWLGEVDRWIGGLFAGGRVRLRIESVLKIEIDRNCRYQHPLKNPSIATRKSKKQSKILSLLDVGLRFGAHKCMSKTVGRFQNLDTFRRRPLLTFVYLRH